MGFTEVLADLPPLETNRLLLRQMTLDDAAAMFEYASEPEVTQYVLWKTHSSIADTKAFLAGVVEQYRRGWIADWGIEHKAHGKFIGTCGFANWNAEHASGKIGYVLAKPYWGKGYMTEAVRSIIAFGFTQMKLNRIEADCKAENIASARVMEKAGMTLEGTLRQSIFVKGSYWDIKLYSILRKEWAELEKL